MPGRRALKPHGVSISDAECREERRKGVTDKRSVKMREVPRSGHDQRTQDESRGDSPKCGAGSFHETARPSIATLDQALAAACFKRSSSMTTGVLALILCCNCACM